MDSIDNESEEKLAKISKNTKRFGLFVSECTKINFSKRG